MTVTLHPTLYPHPTPSAVNPLAKNHGVSLWTAVSHIITRVRDWWGWQMIADYMWTHLWLDQLLLLLVGVWALRKLFRLARIPGQRRRARARYHARLGQTRAAIGTPVWTPFSEPTQTVPAHSDPFGATAAHPWAS